MSYFGCVKVHEICCGRVGRNRVVGNEHFVGGYRGTLHRTVSVKRPKAIDYLHPVLDSLVDQCQLIIEVLMVQQPHRIRITTPQILDAERSHSHRMSFKDGNRNEAVNIVKQQVWKFDPDRFSAYALSYPRSRELRQVHHFNVGEVLSYVVNAMVSQRCICGKRVISSIRFTYQKAFYQRADDFDDCLYHQRRRCYAELMDTVCQVRLNEHR